AALTPNAGLAAVSELCDRLDVIGALDAAVGPVKQRDRGYGAGQLLAGIAAAQLAGEDFLVGLDRQRADAAGQQITPVPGLSSTTAAGLARRITGAQWEAVGQGGGGPGPRAGRPGPRGRSCCPLPWARAPTTRAPARRACCAARWPPCRRGRGPGAASRRVSTPGISPGRSPAPPTTSTSASPSALSASPRCGGCWTASAKTTGPMPSRWTARRSRWPITGRTGGRGAPRC